MTDQQLNILIVIPVFNHGDTLGAVTRRAIATTIPVLVVDDGSTDNGYLNVEALDCELIRLSSNMGKGEAILAGIRFAMENGYDAVVTLDADGQHDPAEVVKLVEKAREWSWPAIVIGDRLMTQSSVPQSSHFGRSFSNFWVRLECGEDLSDTQSGMRIYPVEQLLELNLTRSRYDFEVEVLVKSAWAGISIASVPVSVHYPPGDQRVSHFDKLIDNWRLTRLHTSLLVQRLLPFSPKLLAASASPRSPKETISVKNPLKALKALCVENSSPFWLATAVWVGIFLGALPLLAAHTIAIIYVTHRLYLNKIAAVAASQFCMPPLVPVLCVEVGHFILHGELLFDLSWEKWGLEIHHRLFEWFIGSLLVGPVLGVIAGGIVYSAARRLNPGIEESV